MKIPENHSQFTEKEIKCKGDCAGVLTAKAYEPGLVKKWDEFANEPEEEEKT